VETRVLGGYSGDLRGDVSTLSTRTHACCEYLAAVKTWSKWNRFVSPPSRTRTVRSSA
jgi:hypothetical protein